MSDLIQKVEVIKYSVLLVLALGLSGCGGSSNSESEATTRVLIDSPVNGVSYSCNGESGITQNGGQFTCESAPVTFSIGGLKLGTINQFNEDERVFPQDFSEVGRDNFSDAKTLKLARLFQSFDDDGDISEVIDIPSSIAAKFNNTIDMDDYSISEIAQLAGVDLVSTAYAISHLRRTLAGGVGHSGYRIQIDLTDATPNKSITTDVALTIKGAEVFSGDNPLGNTMTLDGLFKKVTLHLNNPPEPGQDIKIITRAKGYIDSGASIALSTDRTEYGLNLKLVKDAEGVIAPGVYSRDMAIVDKVDDSGFVTEVITLENKESANKPGVKLTIPVDTQFTDKNGNVVKGAKLKITNFDPYESNAIAAYPGGLNVIAEASGFNIAGEPQVGSREINFKSAGFVAIGIEDADGNKVKNFSQDIEIAMQFAIGTRDGEGNVVAIGDEVPIWSYEEDTGKWSYEKVGIVQDLDLSDGLYDVVYSLNHLSYWNLDWHYGEKCTTSNFNLKDLDGNPHEVNRFAFQLTVNSFPSVDRWLTTIATDSFLSFYNAPAGFSGSLKVWTKDKAALLSALVFTDTCSTAEHELEFAYDETSYDYEAALRTIEDLNNRNDKSVGVRPILASINFVFSVAELLAGQGEDAKSEELFAKITAVVLDFSSAFINADGYLGVTFDQYGCDTTQEFYVQELIENFSYQATFNGPLADEFIATVFPIINTAAQAFLNFTPNNLAYTVYGIRGFVDCGLGHATRLADIGDETDYLSMVFDHVETVALVSVATMKTDVETELALNGNVFASTAATFEFIINDALGVASSLASSGAGFSASTLTTINDALAYINELRATGKVLNDTDGPL